MFTIKIEGIKEAEQMLGNLAKELPFALSKALNVTAKQIKEAEINEMKQVFDRPTPFITNGMFIFPSTKSRLSVEVGFKDKQSHMLIPHVEGGSRDMKRSEILLGRRYYTTGQGARLNKYGNISSGQITQLLSVLKRSADPLQNITPRSRMKNKKARDYFMLRAQKGRLRPGVWERTSGKGIKPILIFIENPQYRSRFHFRKIAQAVVAAHWEQNFKEAIAYAIRTSKT